MNCSGCELVLRKDQVPATRLGQSRGNAPRLGWVSWLGDRPRQRDATDVRMRAEGHAAGSPAPALQTASRPSS
jgi:type VI secretion system protein ImpH